MRFPRNIAYLLVLPYIIYFVIFLAYPLIFSFILVFHKWNIVGSMKWIGTANFSFLVRDELFWISLWNTFRFLLVHIPLQIGLALVLAEILNWRIRGLSFYRASFFLPVIISGVVITILWRELYATETGLINTVLVKLGLGKVPWITDRSMAMPSIAIMATWKNVGLYVVLLLAGLQNIPRELYESAAIDGASRVQQFRFITIPVINPVLLMVVIFSTINGFSLFIEPYIMTAGGPLNSTLSTVLYIYKQAFSFYKMGYAATIGFALAIVIFVVVVIQRKIIEREF
ncbi:MAG: carbohydrate ABC transporter permease [Fidelibacterota bacterium]